MAGSFAEERTCSCVAAIQYTVCLINQFIHCSFAPEWWWFNLWQNR